MTDTPTLGGVVEQVSPDVAALRKVEELTVIAAGCDFSTEHRCVDRCPPGDCRFITGLTAALTTSESARLDAVARIAEMEAALTLILPMAKGYAAEHPVGSNAQYVAEAEAVLSPSPREEGGR